MRILMTLVTATAVMLGGFMKVQADRVSRQTFVAHVLPRVSVKSPPRGATSILDPSQVHVQFTQQDWDVTTNSLSGATIQFVTEHSFHNQNHSNIRRDAQLELRILSQSKSGTWTVTQPSGVTNHELGQELATVQVNSISPGFAVVGLTVTFLQGASLSTPDGDYETTVIGTITAN